METPVTRAMEVFKRHNPPAPDRDHSDDAMNTDDILNKFQDLAGEKAIDKEQLCAMLTKNGYIFDWVFDEFCWLIQRQK